MQADALLLSFQGQLSGIMESILRSALVEITRLVEGSLLEEVGRGKQQADVLRRRVQVLENRLAERERVKRVRCADCGRAGLRKDSRETRTRTGLEAVCVTKLEGVSEGGRRSCERRGVTAGQKETPAQPDSEQVADGIGAKMEGVIKDEDPLIEEKQVCPSGGSHAADTSEPQSHALRERAGTCTSQPEVQSSQRDKLPVTGSSAAAAKDLNKQRSSLRKAEHHVQSSQSQPPLSTGGAPPEIPPTVNPAASNPESVAIKQEVVVVLPPDWGAASAAGRVNRGQDVQHTTPPALTEDKPSYPGHRAKDSHSTAVTEKKQPKPAEHSSPGTVGPSYPKSPPVSNPSRMLPQFHRVYGGDGAVSSVQTGRTPSHGLAVRAHHMARRPYICNHCGKVFSQLCHLKGHQQIHTGERQFCCNLCGRSFTKLSNLKAHRRVHTGERPYICLDCGKRFTQKCNLKRHQRIHSAHL